MVRFIHDKINQRNSLYSTKHTASVTYTLFFSNLSEKSEIKYTLKFVKQTVLDQTDNHIHMLAFLLNLIHFISKKLCLIS